MQPHVVPDGRVVVVDVTEPERSHLQSPPPVRYGWRPVGITTMDHGCFGFPAFKGLFLGDATRGVGLSNRFGPIGACEDLDWKRPPKKSLEFPKRAGDFERFTFVPFMQLCRGVQ